jgi:hypothetical protein
MGDITNNTPTRKTKMIFTNENELFNAVDNDVNVIGATYTGEVEHGVTESSPDTLKNNSRIFQDFV